MKEKKPYSLMKTQYKESPSIHAAADTVKPSGKNKKEEAFWTAQNQCMQKRRPSTWKKRGKIDKREEENMGERGERKQVGPMQKTGNR